MNHSLAERNSRLKNIPFYVLSKAYSCAKDGKSIEESKIIIDSHCQKEFVALSQQKFRNFSQKTLGKSIY